MGPVGAKEAVSLVDRNGPDILSSTFVLMCLLWSGEQRGGRGQGFKNVFYIQRCEISQ